MHAHVWRQRAAKVDLPGSGLTHQTPKPSPLPTQAYTRYDWPDEDG